MSSDEEAASQVELSEFETQFVPRSNDDEVLYEVLEITAEKGKRYRVKWAGKDPKTGKPWPQDWVDKHDCTADLVKEWKAKKTSKKEKRGGRTSIKSRASTSSKVSTPTISRRTRNTADPDPPLQSASESEENLTKAGSSSTKPQSSKRKRDSIDVSPPRSSENPQPTEFISGRPSKKQKLILEVLVPPLSPGDESDRSNSPKLHEEQLSHEENDNDGVEQAHTNTNVPITKVGPPRGVKRKPKAQGSTTSKQHASTSSRSPHVSPQPTHDVRASTSAVSTNSEPSHKPPRKPTQIATSLTVPNPNETDSFVRKAKSQTPNRSHSKFSTTTAPSPHPSAQLNTSIVPAIRRSPILSPGAKARLEQFDRQMAEDPSPIKNGDLQPGHSLDNAPDIDYEIDHNMGDSHNDLVQDLEAEFEPLESAARISTPVPSSPPSRSAQAPRPTPTPAPAVAPKSLSNNCTTVPETESSNNNTDQSQSQSQPFQPVSQPVPSHRRSISPSVSLPAIAILVAPSSSPHDRDAKQVSAAAGPSKPNPIYSNRLTSKGQKAIPKISPATFRAKVVPLQAQRLANVEAADEDAPMSSIESFPSPSLRKNKGKGRMADSVEGNMDSSDDNNPKQKPGITDSALRKRGTALFDLALQSKKERGKLPKKPLINFLNDRVTQLERGSGRGKQTAVIELAPEYGEDMAVDQSGVANSATLDTTGSGEHGNGNKLKTISQLRQEEEESTQDLLQEEERLRSKLSNGHQAAEELVETGDSQDPPALSHNQDPVSHPSAQSAQDGDSQLASVIVHPSQGQVPLGEEPHEPQQPFATPPISPPRANLNGSARRLSDALSLLNLKSEEIQRLESESAEHRRRIAMLEQDIAIAKLGTHVPSTSTSTQTTDHMHPDTAELAKIRVQWEAEKAAWNKQSVEWDIELRKERADHNTDLIAWTRKHKLLQEKLEETEAVAEQNRVWFDNERDIWNTERVRRPLEVAALKSECALLAQELEARTEKCKKLSDQLRDSVKANEDKTAWRKEQEEREAERFIWDVERSSWIQEREDHTTWNNRLAAWENERVAVDKERATWVEERTRLQTQVAALEEKNVQQDASHEKEGALWKADRVILEEKLDAVTTSLATLTTSTEALTQGKLSAEKDRDFFRDQYSQASAFVSSVRQENMALEEQANIAESRAKDGVAMVKGMFETQMQHLEDDLTRWKGLAELMQEKDRLTGDEVRRRAAEEPELRERCEWLVEKLMSREEELRRIGNSQRKLKAERSRLESKILKLQKQRSLYKSISEKPPRQGTNTVDIPATNGVSSEHDPSAVSDDEHGARVGLFNGDDVDDTDDDYTWFPCKWRPDGPKQCPHTFDCIEDLERHILEHLGVSLN